RLKPRAQCLIEAIGQLLQVGKDGRLKGGRFSRLKIVARAVAVEDGDAPEFGPRHVAALAAPSGLIGDAIQLEADGGARRELLEVRIIGVGVDRAGAPGAARLLQHARIAGLAGAVAAVCDGESLW